MFDPAHGAAVVAGPVPTPLPAIGVRLAADGGLYVTGSSYSSGGTGMGTTAETDNVTVAGTVAVEVEPATTWS